ncbi:filamentous hemagglutinin N-terminal domain-containing protein [uncultured Lamprocystis sp.]|jgi:filamentous hemagglutinin family protein|uniref:two-partner secretion domain-containing protein n=2 Tax=uncultured Lamprocystis sp. TaxID=543132 RepID=UPI0025E96B48|nr:filamentous hemagglutinin N-terminal domain-containing protein [uncultured Lamprocystis sp.]
MTSAPRTQSPALSTGLVPVPAVFKERELARLVRIGLLVPLALGAALQPGLPWAAPAGGRVVGGSGSIESGGNLTQIQQGSHRLAIDWQSYNVGANETVRYLQPSASAAALNRVLDGNPSQILGRIEANGQVFLMNPSGIIFGRNATVNVGSLVAAAMDMDKAKFMNGIYEMGVPAGIEPGMVVNQGLLEAATGGSVTLVGGAVRNEGAIIAKLGQVNLGAGRRAVVDFDGNDIIRFEVDGELTANTHQVESAVSNTGTIDAAGGTVLMTAKTAGDVFTSVVNNEGIVRAGSIDTQGGEIRLTGSGGLVRNSGTLDASRKTGGKVSVKGLKIDHTGRILAEGRDGAGGQAVLEAVDTTTVSKGGVISVRAGTGGKGGRADVLGERVALLDQARIDASGGQGGGKIRVGGDYQGKNAAVKNAKRTHVGAGVTMAADAGERGDGGTVIVWADEDTRYFGAISAIGGARSGNGGFAEVSGKQYLDYSGTADLRAAAGATGTLLLDPNNITISTGADDKNGGTGTLEDPFTSTNDTSVLALWDLSRSHSFLKTAG